MMLNEWVFDVRLMKQQITRLFILLHTDTIFIDRPTDPVGSSLETLWLFSLRTVPRTLCSPVSRPPFVRRLPSIVFCLSLRLQISLCCSSLHRPLYIKKRCSTLGLSANRYISLFGLDESRRPTRQGFSLQFVLCPRCNFLNIYRY